MILLICIFTPFKTKCGSSRMLKKMEEYITLVNVGLAGLAYYSNAINNKSIFNA